MRICVLLEKIIAYGDKVYQTASADYINYPTHGWLGSEARRSVHWMWLPAGTYTVSATLSGNVTCKVYTYDTDLQAAGMFPADDSEGVLPYTFTLTETRQIGITFAYAGWGDTEMSAAAVTDIHVHNTISPQTGEVSETILLRPDEIDGGDTLSQAINSKSTLKLMVYPQFEAWGFAEQTITYVTALDLDKAEDRVIFRGRVSGIQSRMDSSGRYVQEITCGSAVSFLEDTYSEIGSVGNSLQTVVSDWLIGSAGGQYGHNSQLDGQNDVIRRGFVPGSIGTASVNGFIDMDTTYSTLHDLVSGSSHLSHGGESGYKMEFRERYYHGLNYIDILEKIGVHKNEPIKIGENLKEIRFERGITEGYYTRVCVRSGVNSDGYRNRAFATNQDMAVKYPTCTKYMVADEIKCTAPRYDDYGVQTLEYEQMLSWLRARARAEAAKLGSPYVKITLSALDLARIGMDDYEGFELGNWHPCVCPKLGLYGDEVRITAIRRNLADGKTAELTVEAGERLDGDKSSSTLSGQLSRISRIEQRLDSDSASQTEITDGKIDTALDGNKVRRMTKSEYDALGTYDSTILYNVDNNGTNELYIGSDHISSGGGGGQCENRIIRGDSSTGVRAGTTTQWKVAVGSVSAAFLRSHGVTNRLTFYTPDRPGALQAVYFASGRLVYENGDTKTRVNVQRTPDYFTICVSDIYYSVSDDNREVYGGTAGLRGMMLKLYGLFGSTVSVITEFSTVCPTFIYLNINTTIG